MIWDLTISDGYTITHHYFKKAESAQKAMAEMYYDLMIQCFDFGSRTTDELSEDEKYWYDCSSLSEYSAIVFCNGEEVHVMDITAIDPSRITFEEE